MKTLYLAFLMGILVILSAACTPSAAAPTATPHADGGLAICGPATPNATEDNCYIVTPNATLQPSGGGLLLPMQPQVGTPLPAAPSPTFTPTLTPTLTLTPTPQAQNAAPPEITLLFTGQIVPARCVQAAAETRGNPDYVYDAVRPILQSADLTIGALNSSLTAYPPTTGCKRTFVLVGRPWHADAMVRAGFDVMSVATNHIKNCGLMTCGERAFFDTLETLKTAGIAAVGAGANLNEAMQPIVIEIEGVRFGFVSLGQIEESAFAGESTPGIAVLTPENLRAAITALRPLCDVLIVLPHWGPEYSATPNWSQRELAKIAVEAGADLVVGNHTHVVQGMQQIDGVWVFYGLGNFVFDQDWSRETMQSVMLRVVYDGANLREYELIPVVSSGEGELFYPDESEKSQILARIDAASQGLR
ncbi:MAG: hypothetical protein OHK0052_12830 [Anaerolineales bacterium]